MRRHRLTPLLAALLAWALFAGCAPHATRVRLEAVAGEAPLAPATYAIRHGQPDAPPSAHENHRQRRALARALDSLGFSEAAPDGCDVLVWLHFGLVGEETPHQGPLSNISSSWTCAPWTRRTCAPGVPSAGSGGPGPRPMPTWTSASRCSGRS